MKESNSFLEVIRDVFHDSPVLENAILIGSIATCFYEQRFPGYNPYVMTQDIDFLYSNISKPREQIPFTKIMKEKGFEAIKDRMTDVTRFINKNNVEIEFLVHAKGAGKESSYLIAPLGIRGEGLRHLDILDNNTMVVKYKDIVFKIPTPSAYVIHKMIINDARERQGKAAKDREGISSLLKAISNSSRDRTEFLEIYASLTKKEKKLFDDTVHKLSTIDQRYIQICLPNEYGIDHNYMFRKENINDILAEINVKVKKSSINNHNKTIHSRGDDSER